jgi:hypothetical protein
MRKRTFHLVLLLDGIVLLGVIVFSAYTISTRILPMGAVEQKRKIDPQAQILQYYRQYPERYIRISKESWKYDANSRIASHTLTLTNSATVPYHLIDLGFSFETANGKILHTQIVSVPGILAAGGVMDVKKIRVKNVPNAAENVVVTVAKALVY